MKEEGRRQKDAVANIFTLITSSTGVLQTVVVRCFQGFLDYDSLVFHLIHFELNSEVGDIPLNKFPRQKEHTGGYEQGLVVEDDLPLAVTPNDPGDIVVSPEIHPASFSFRYSSFHVTAVELGLFSVFENIEICWRPLGCRLGRMSG